MWIIDRQLYERALQQLDSGRPEMLQAADRLKTLAETYCHRHAPAVTDKTFTPQSPSTDPHDYVSIGTYWWPNPATKDGTPYIRRDGQLSPESARYDRPRWNEAVEGITSTIRAAYFLRDARAAEEAVRRLRRWFIDPSSRMNPHLCYAQMVPGQSTGRPLGIIDFALYLPGMLDGVSLLAALPHSPWTLEDQRALRAWCDALYTWLKTHEYGDAERQMANNHGTFYDRLLVVLALFLEHKTYAMAYLHQQLRMRIATQIEADGRIPHEFQRTCSLGYTLLNLQGLLELALIARRLGDDLWHWATEDGRSMRVAVDWMYQFACGQEDWPYQQIEPIDWRMVAILFMKANMLAGEIYDLSRLAHRLPANFTVEAFVLLEPTHPFGRERIPDIT